MAVLHALKLLHGAGFVHMDVKPSNIIKVAGDGGMFDKWKLFDLDTSRRKNEPVGGFTANYAAPELARASLKGDETPLADPKMDVWATGLVLLEMATLQPLVKPPAEGSDGNSAALEELAGEGLQSKLQEQLASLKTENRDLHRALLGDETQPQPRAMLSVDPRVRLSAAESLEKHCFSHRSITTVSGQITKGLHKVIEAQGEIKEAVDEVDKKVERLQLSLDRWQGQRRSASSSWPKASSTCASGTSPSSPRTEAAAGGPSSSGWCSRPSTLIRRRSCGRRRKATTLGCPRSLSASTPGSSS